MSVIEEMNYNFENPTKNGQDKIISDLIDVSVRNNTFSYMNDYFEMFSSSKKIIEKINMLKDQFGIEEFEEVEEHRNVR